MCERVNIGGTLGWAIACRSRQRRALCQFCKRKPHTALCDFPMDAGVGTLGGPTTCDAKMCEDCRTPQDMKRDYCPRHKGMGAMKFPATRRALTDAGYVFEFSRPCKRCGHEIEFYRTPTSARAPLEVVPANGEWLLVSHFTTCPFANEFRKKQEPVKATPAHQEKLF